VESGKMGMVQNPCEQGNKHRGGVTDLHSILHRNARWLLPGFEPRRKMTDRCVATTEEMPTYDDKSFFHLPPKKWKNGSSGASPEGSKAAAEAAARSADLLFLARNGPYGPHECDSPVLDPGMPSQTVHVCVWQKGAFMEGLTGAQAVLQRGWNLGCVRSLGNLAGLVSADGAAPGSAPNTR